MTPAFTTRAATAQDDDFLFVLFKAVRSEDFVLVSATPAQIESLLRMQYAGQKQTYGTQYPGGNRIVLLEGRPIGRIWLFQGPAGHHLVDISLLPEYRNCRIGAALVTEAATAARAAGVSLCCSVAVTNHGSLRFHQRHGFRITSRDELYYHLELS